MSGFIKHLKNPFTGNKIFPVTKTRAVYNQDGTRLDKYIDALYGSPDSNILINGNFANPVNQRGETSYTPDGSIIYTIDRWRLFAGESVEGVKSFLSVNGGYITLTAPSGVYYGEICQFIEYPERYAGKTVTLSAKCKIPVGYKAMLRILYNENTPAGHNDIYTIVSGTGDWRIIKLTCTVPSIDITNMRIFDILLIKDYNEENKEFTKFTASASIDIEWAKTELGEIATPYVPRSYGEELQLCKRYYQTVNLQTLDYIGNDQIDFICHMLVNMRTNPTVDLSNIVLYKGGIRQTDFEASAVNTYPTYATIRFAKIAHGLEVNDVLFMSGNIICDAEM